MTEHQKLQSDGLLYSLDFLSPLAVPLNSSTKEACYQITPQSANATYFVNETASLF